MYKKKRDGLKNKIVIQIIF